MDQIQVCMNCGYVLKKEGRCRRCLWPESKPLNLDDVYYIQQGEGGSSYIFFSRRKLKIRRRHWRAVWDKTKDGIFLICPQCKKINDVSHEKGSRSLGRKRARGFVRDCVVCWNCGSHFWVYLHGYGKKRGRDYE